MFNLRVLVRNTPRVLVHDFRISIDPKRHVHILSRQLDTE